MIAGRLPRSIAGGACRGLGAPEADRAPCSRDVDFRYGERSAARLAAAAKGPPPGAIGGVAAGGGAGYICWMLRSLAEPRLVLALILAVSAGALVLALLGQHAFGLQPCVLCLYQRLPYIATAMIASIALVAGVRTGRWTLWPVLACAGMFAACGLLALYHVGVEAHWWAAVTGCGGTPDVAGDVFDLRAALTATPRPCDRVDFRLFGLSLAGWNTLASAALAAGCVLLARAAQPRTAS